MKSRKRAGLILILAFVMVTGILFTADFASGPGQQTCEKTGPDREELPGQQVSESAMETGEEGPDPLIQISETEEKIYVYVCGAVRNPGVYCLEPGARVFEALEEAGGVTAKGQAQLLNLAQPLSDGERIYVPSEGETAGLPADAGTVSGQDPAVAGEQTSVNINTAGKEQLMTLPGIGSSRAEDILAYRQEQGPFASCDDLMKVAGIGEGIYARLKDRITVR